MWNSPPKQTFVKMPDRCKWSGWIRVQKSPDYLINNIISIQEPLDRLSSQTAVEADSTRIFFVTFTHH